jgi:septal ring factor EnvC (AmiA/AmiB activator)
VTGLLRPLFALACIATCLPIASAEQVYVIDKLLVGIHAEKDLDSAIVKVLPTGSVLDVVERDGELALVVDAEQNKGWVDAAYLTSEKPAALRLTALEAEKAALEQRIKEFEAPAGTPATARPASSDVQAQIEAITRENTDLKGKLSDERLRAGQLQSEVATLRGELRENTTPPDARIVELERTRKQLERDLARAENAVEELTARSSLQPTAAMVPLVMREYGLSIVLLAGLLAALAFGAGMYVVDALNRRRHGGFRI